MEKSISQRIRQARTNHQHETWDNKAPYITSELKFLIRQRDYLKAKANETGSRYFYQAFLNIRNQVKRLLYKLGKNYYSQKIEECKGDMKATWKVLKRAIKQPRKSSNIEKIQYMGNEITDTKMIAEVCNEHFVTIGKKLADEVVQTGVSSLYAHLKTADTRFKFKPVTADQLQQTISKLINSKATGIHNILNIILKASMNIMSSSLCDIFTSAISSNQFIDDLKMTKIAVIFKAGERDDLNNYRPISVLPTIARVFEKLIYKQLYDYFTVNNPLDNKQYGFRSLHSTGLALGNLTNTWLLNIDNGKMNSVVFLDIKKAFDTVDHKY